MLGAQHAASVPTIRHSSSASKLDADPKRLPSQWQAEATKAAQRAGIEHAKRGEDRAYLGRKPSFTRDQFTKVSGMLGQGAVGISQIAKTAKLNRQTVYRIKDDAAGAEAALSAWGL